MGFRCRRGTISALEQTAARRCERDELTAIGRRVHGGTVASSTLSPGACSPRAQGLPRRDIRSAQLSWLPFRARLTAELDRGFACRMTTETTLSHVVPYDREVHQVKQLIPRQRSAPTAGLDSVAQSRRRWPPSGPSERSKSRLKMSARPSAPQLVPSAQRHPETLAPTPATGFSASAATSPRHQSA